jgi:hypothetical protein
VPDPRHASSAGLGGKVNGFLDKEIAHFQSVDAKRVREKFPDRAQRVRKEARRAQREADSA